MSETDRGDDPSPTAAPPLELEVRGRPVPKGAVSAFVVPGKSGKRARAVVVQGGSKAKRSALAEWSSAIQDAALVAVGARELEVARFVACPVAVSICFRLARPKSHFGTGKNAGKLKADAPPYPTGTPDIDKLTRAVLDALIGVAFDDDSRVVRLETDKVYGELEGARITVRAMGSAAQVAAVPILTLVPPPPPPPPVPILTLVPPPPPPPPDPPTVLEEHVPPPAPPSDRRVAMQARIREIIGGTPIDAELRTFGKGHTLDRHGSTASELRLLEANDAVELDVRDPIDVAIAAGDRGELARRLLAAPSGSLEERRCIAALAGKPVRPADLEDDFGGADL